MAVISPEAFLEAFRITWSTYADKQSSEIFEAFGNDTAWTDIMLANPGLLSKVMGHLGKKMAGLSYRSEWYKIDAIYAGGSNLINRQDCAYPSKLEALIEHENGDNVEEEMYKLLFWRSPLKIIIFYDWNEYLKTTDKRKNWLNQKIQCFKNMLDTANNDFPEIEDTKYLYVIGNIVEKGQLPQWRWASERGAPPKTFVKGYVPE